jgi:hypothetical protein
MATLTNGKSLVEEYYWQRWNAKNPFPPDEPGEPCINLHIAKAAGACRTIGIRQEFAEEWIRAAMTRREKSRTEVSRTVARAYQSEQTSTPADREPTPEYNPDRLTQYAALVPFEITEDWLAEASPECVLDATSDSFLRSGIYQTGEHVAVLTRYPTGGYRIEGTWSHDEPPDAMDYLRTGQDAGVWYSCNPVNPCSTSWSEPNVTSWRYGVLESDKAPADLWLRAVVLMRLPIVAIYTSGGRSIHVLYRVDAESKADWDAKVKPIKRALVPIGCH